MILFGIDFPNQILEAAKNDKLVIFAGAGVSMGDPTCLPNFKTLAEKIADGTGMELGTREDYDKFIGEIEAKGINAHTRAAKILYSYSPKHNILHEGIIELFSDQTKIRIITTNYDHMFESVLDQKGSKQSVYNNPFLPSDENFYGIVHLHGNIDDPINMILTDADFGRAYIDKHNVSDFIRKVFTDKVILFIGYSYKDIIMSYLTRALSEVNTGNRYILTDALNSNWKFLGLTPILFPDQQFDQLNEGVKELGKIATRSLLDWNNYFKKYNNLPPQNISDISIIEYCLKDLEISVVLSRNISSSDWLDFLESRGIFDNIFSDSNSIDKFDELWTQWIISSHVGKDDNKLLSLFDKKGNKLSKYFSDSLLRKITFHGHDIQNEYFQKYILYLEKFIIEHWYIRELIKTSGQRKLEILCFQLFKIYFTFSFTLEKNYYTNSLEFRHHFIGDYHIIMDSWQECRDFLLEKYSKEIILFLMNILNELFLKYSGFDKVPYPINHLVIENRNGEPFTYKPLNAIEKIIFQSREAIENIDSGFVRFIILLYLQSDCIFLKKIGLKNLRETNTFTENEKYDLFLKYSSYKYSPEKEQAYLLIAKIFNQISKDRKDSFIDILESMKDNFESIPHENSLHEIYEIYNWGIWIQKNCHDNSRINKLVDSIQRAYGFKPREYPERDFGPVVSGWVKHISPYSEKELKEMTQESLFDLLKNYQGNNHQENFLNRIDKEGLLIQFSECVQKDFSWAVNIIDGMANYRITDDNTWNYFLNGINNSDFSLEELVLILKKIVESITLLPDVFDVSRLLMKILECQDIESEYKNYEEVLFSTSEIIWNNRNHTEPTISSEFYVLNTTTGIILLCWNKMIYFEKSNSLQEKYKSYFDNILSMQSWERNVAIEILAGCYAFLYHKDENWTKNTIVPILEGGEEESYKYAWDGVVHYSFYIDLSISDILSDLFLKAVDHIQWLSETTRSRFIDLFLILLIKVIENPIILFIPKFYLNSSEEDKIHFIEEIERKLSEMEKGEKLQWWNKWLKDFLENRMNNIPEKLSEKERTAIFNWLPNFDDEFDDAVNIFCNYDFPCEVDPAFFFTMEDNNRAQTHPESTIALIIKLLNSSSHFYFGEHYLESIIAKAIDKIGKDQKRKLQEGLLRRNIDLQISGDILC